MATDQEVKQAREALERKRAEVAARRQGNVDAAFEAANDMTLKAMEAESERLDAELADVENVRVIEPASIADTYQARREAANAMADAVASRAAEDEAKADDGVDVATVRANAAKTAAERTVPAPSPAPPSPPATEAAKAEKEK